MTRILPAAALAFAVAACGDSSTGPGGEQELISRVTITFTPTTIGVPVATAYIDDPDGLGPLPPSAQSNSLVLQSGVTYTGSIRFENRLVTPPEDITLEVAEEDEEHGVIYTIGGLESAVLNVTDADGLGKFLGLTFTFLSDDEFANGTLRTVLCHYDGVVKPATATSCSGDTDVDVTFTLETILNTVREQR